MMNILSNKEKSDMLKDLLFVTVISADNDEYSEEVKQEILSRHDKASKDYKSPTDSRIDWDYVFEPIGEKAHRYAEIMRAE